MYLHTKPKVGAMGFNLSDSIDTLIADLERAMADLAVEIQDEAVRYSRRLLEAGKKAQERQGDASRRLVGLPFNSLGEVQSMPKVNEQTAAYNVMYDTHRYLVEMRRLSQEEPEPKESASEKFFGDLPVKKKGKKGKKK